MDKIDEIVSNLTTTVNKFVTENNNSSFMKSIDTRINTIEDTVLNLSSTVTKFVDYVSKTKISQPSDEEKLKSKIEKLELDKEKYSEEINKQNEVWSRKLKDLGIKHKTSQCENLGQTEQSRLRIADLSNKLEKAEHLVEQKSTIIHKLEDKMETQKDLINELESDKKVLTARLHERDLATEQSAERTRMARYDRDGGSWSTSKPQSPHRETVENGILLLHDSICKYIDLQLFAGSTAFAGKTKKVKCPTIDILADSLTDFNGNFDHIIIHVGVNDLRNQNLSVGQVFKKYEDMVHEVQKRASKVTLSLLVPCEEQPLSSNIVALNSLIQSKFSKSDNIKVCINDNFSKQGSRIENLYEDDMHLNKQGTKVLCSNLKKSLFGVTPRNQRDSSVGRQSANFHRQSTGFNRQFNRGRGRNNNNRNFQGNRDVANTLAQALLGAFSQ